MTIDGLSPSLRAALDGARKELHSRIGLTAEISEATPGGAAFGGWFSSSHTIRLDHRAITLWPEDEGLTWLEYSDGDVRAIAEIRSDVPLEVARKWLAGLLAGEAVVRHGLLRRTRRIELKYGGERLSLAIV